MGYEKVRIFPRNGALYNVNRVMEKDIMEITTDYSIALEYEGFSTVQMNMTDMVEKIEMYYVNPEYNTEFRILEVPFSSGLMLRVVLKESYAQTNIEVTSLCPTFMKLFPCIYIPACHPDVEGMLPFAYLDLKDFVWTPIDFLPRSPTETVHGVSSSWKRVANWFIPLNELHPQNFISGKCMSSVGNRHDILDRALPWFPSVKAVYGGQIRYSHLIVDTLNSRAPVILHDSYIIPSNITIPGYLHWDNSDDRSIIIHEVKDGKPYRTTLKGTHIRTKEHEIPNWQGSVDFSLLHPELHGFHNHLLVKGHVTRPNGVYNPQLDLYDSAVALTFFIPKGAYVDLDDLQLMHSMGRFPSYVTYVPFVDIELPYHKSQAQLVTVLLNVTINTLSLKVDIDFTLPIHFRYVIPSFRIVNGTYISIPQPITIPPPAVHICSPVRDSDDVTTIPKWWELVSVQASGSISVVLPVGNVARLRLVNTVTVIFVSLAVLAVCVELVCMQRRSSTDKEKEKEE